MNLAFCLCSVNYKLSFLVESVDAMTPSEPMTRRPLNAVGSFVISYFSFSEVRQVYNAHSTLSLFKSRCNVSRDSQIFLNSVESLPPLKSFSQSLLPPRPRAFL